MKRGQIYYVRSNYREEGSEQRGGRPAVIVSNDKNNAKSNTVEERNSIPGRRVCSGWNELPGRVVRPQSNQEGKEER